MKVSVAMATYNGAKYIESQLESILGQLMDGDELIICDDGSRDTTIAVIERYMGFEKRIKLYRNQSLGVIRNFEYALMKCQNDIIIFSDQDDIWLGNKVQRIRFIFENEQKYNVILHNAKIQEGNKVLSNKLIRSMRHGLVINICSSSYWGCCMAIRRSWIRKYLPFNTFVPAYDQYIGLLAEKSRTSYFIEDELIIHRLHGNNCTKRGSIYHKVIFRLRLILAILV